MSYSIKRDGKTYMVVEDQSGEVLSGHWSYQEAQHHISKLSLETFRIALLNTGEQPTFKFDEIEE